MDILDGQRLAVQMWQIIWFNMIKNKGSDANLLLLKMHGPPSIIFIFFVGTWTIVLHSRWMKWKGVIPFPLSICILVFLQSDFGAMRFFSKIKERGFKNQGIKISLSRITQMPFPLMLNILNISNNT